MARFFIDRPVFAWVIALFILVAGAVSITRMPITQYPSVAPPTISVNAVYPGASAETMDNAVVSLIEQEMNGSPGMLYMESVTQANGTASVSITFDPKIDPDLAQIDVQNRLSRATPRLPQAVVQQGVQVTQARTNFLLFVMTYSEGGVLSPIEIGDYVSRSILPELQRVDGVGQARLFGTERAMRIWLDPARLRAYGLAPADVNAAIRAQNAQVSAGGIGELPNTETQAISAAVVVAGQLETPDQFANIVLRANPDGSTVRLRDVARVELGGQAYSTFARLNGANAVGVGIQLASTGNAMATAAAIGERMKTLSQSFPPSLRYAIPYDTSKFVRLSIIQVVETLAEAIALVFLVMLLFLQSFRYTLIPTIVVPVALMGTFGVLLALGYSVNVLTMFAMVLAIGILVDDAIVVVENVERIMAEERLSPREATRKAMGQITNAIIGITTVLVSVFVPMAMFGGAVGNIYRQFAVTMVSSMLFSAFLALSLTPALCATLLKPVKDGHHERRGLAGLFNRGFARTTRGTVGIVRRILRMSWLALLIYAVLVWACGSLLVKMPSSFLPNEDQGFLITNIQLPPGATANRTLEVVKKVEDFYAKQPEVDQVVGVIGFSFSGVGQNAALAFTTFKPWDERLAPGSSAQAIAGRAFAALSSVRDAFIFAVSPPPIRELGNATGFSLRLQDRGGVGREALIAARNQLLGMAAQSPILRGTRPDGLEDAPQLRLEIDRDRAAALGVGFDAISAALGTAIGSSYINDFPNAGRMQRVIVQADAQGRMQPGDLLDLNAMNKTGQPVPFSAFATTRWTTGAMQAIRYNGFPSLRLSGDAAAGYSTGDAMDEIERLIGGLPAGIGFEWTGLSREEKESGSRAPVVLAFSLLAAFLCLAALYESWSIPLAVLLVVPLGVLGSVLAALWRGYPNDVYFTVGLVTIIGLSAKNAILIIEFAKDLHAQGHGVIDATLEALRLRLRPILMTSLAFMLGVLPLAIATGAGSAGQRDLGTGVIGGMLSATVLAVLFVPVFFVVVRRIFPGSRRQHEFEIAHGAGAASAQVATPTGDTPAGSIPLPADRPDDADPSR
ncbi:MAG: efflux RND transporter permease subunit [Burkholderiaceae bacterium]